MEVSPIWAGATEILLTKVLVYLGTELGTEPPSKWPKQLGGIRVAIEQELSRSRGPADMVFTVIGTTVMTRWYLVASAYRLGLAQHKANDTHQLQIFKRSTGCQFIQSRPRRGRLGRHQEWA